MHEIKKLEGLCLLAPSLPHSLLDDEPILVRLYGELCLLSVVLRSINGHVEFRYLSPTIRW